MRVFLLACLALLVVVKGAPKTYLVETVDKPVPKTKAAMPVPKAEVEAGNDYMSSIEELDASTTENETSEYETSEYADHNKDNLTDEDLGSGIDKDENKDKDKDADLGSGSDEDKDEDLGSSSSETENKDKDEHLEDGEVKGDDNYAALPIDGDVIGDDYAALPEDGEVMGEDYAAIVQPFDHAPPPVVEGNDYNGDAPAPPPFDPVLLVTSLAEGKGVKFAENEKYLIPQLNPDHENLGYDLDSVDHTVLKGFLAKIEKTFAKMNVGEKVNGVPGEMKFNPFTAEKIEGVISKL